VVSGLGKDFAKCLETFTLEESLKVEAMVVKVEEHLVVSLHVVGGVEGGCRWGLGRRGRKALVLWKREKGLHVLVGIVAAAGVHALAKAACVL